MAGSLSLFSASHLEGDSLLVSCVEACGSQLRLAKRRSVVGRRLKECCVQGTSCTCGMVDWRMLVDTRFQFSSPGDLLTSRVSLAGRIYLESLTTKQCVFRPDALGNSRMSTYQMWLWWTEQRSSCLTSSTTSHRQCVAVERAAAR